MKRLGKENLRNALGDVTGWIIREKMDSMNAKLN